LKAKYYRCAFIIWRPYCLNGQYIKNYIEFIVIFFVKSVYHSLIVNDTIVLEWQDLDTGCSRRDARAVPDRTKWGEAAASLGHLIHPCAGGLVRVSVGLRVQISRQANEHLFVHRTNFAWREGRERQGQNAQDSHPVG